jgi:hypothetical protein
MQCHPGRHPHRVHLSLRRGVVARSILLPCHSPDGSNWCVNRATADTSIVKSTVVVARHAPDSGLPNLAAEGATRRHAAGSVALCTIDGTRAKVFFSNFEPLLRGCLLNDIRHRNEKFASASIVSHFLQPTQQQQQTT